MTLSSLPRADSPSVWAASSSEDRSWVCSLDLKDAQQLARVIRAAYEPEKSLFDYEVSDFDSRQYSQLWNARFKRPISVVDWRS